ncbi:hypothetical protein [Variovorax sp.]|uniref:hypothetical protein n=1 Tax=Variovorax sp. TaxID=1871043 RepID=UPI002D26A671|nr:hypothetical protein [Variovorax sp.]HYP82818.1 hypothetical protein [Variovorax sp.]
MALLCEHCRAENRNAAKFCKGCGRKIAQSWPSEAPAGLGADPAMALATGVSAAAAPPSLPPWASNDLPEFPGAPGAIDADAPRARLLLPALAGVIIAVASVAWLAIGHRAPSAGLASAAASAAPATPPPAAPSVNAAAPAAKAPPTESTHAAATVDAVPATVAAEPPAVAEQPAPAKPVRKPVARKRAPPPPPPAVAAAPPPEVAPPPPPPPSPQEACAGRNFIAKARCLADQCAQASQRSHPQCQAVRDQQRLEEEKRNPQWAS